MARKKITNYFLYRRRVMLAYIFIAVALIVCLAIGLFIPGGLTQSEQHSSVQAMNAGMLGVNAPYYVLQRLSISFLGLSAFSVKLPSVLCGILLGISLFFLLRRWLTLGIATFSALIIFTSTTFLSLVGTGTPAILYVLYPALMLFFGTRVLSHDRRLVLFSILLVITIALALLTPTMVYLVILALCLAAFNPHIRYGFRRLPTTGLFSLVLGFIIAIAPLAYLTVTDSSTLPMLLVRPSLSTLTDNIGTLLALVGSFLHPSIVAGWPAPLVGLATIGLAAIGLYRTIKAIYTARAQFIFGWSVIAIVLAIIDTGLGILLYLPIVLLASIGLSGLAAIWYRMFPFNPYARISALVPIGVLITGIVIGSSLRYINTTQYADGAAELHSRDLQLVRRYVQEVKYYSTPTLAVDDNDTAFYALGLNDGVLFKKVTHAVVSTSQASNVKGDVVSSEPIPNRTPLRILTDGRTDASDRFYVYKNQ